VCGGDVCYRSPAQSFFPATGRMYAMFEELEWNGIFVDVGRMVRRATNDFVEFLVITYGDQFEAFSNSILGILVWIERLLLGRSEPEIILLIVFGGLISLFVYLISKNSILAGRCLRR
jgi:hypothetical protein